MSPSKSAIAREVPPSQDAPPAATPRSAQTVQFTPGKPGQPAPGPHPLTPHPAAPQPDSPPPVATEPPIVVKKRRGGTRRFVMLVVIPLIALAVGFSWWLDGGRYVTTDNAYVGADKSLITPQVTGPIAAVHVVEGQRVKVGDPLFDIDPKPYEIALSLAKGRLDAAKVEFANLRSSYVSNQDQIKMGQDAVLVRQADFDRKNELATRGSGTSVDRDTSMAALIQAKQLLEFVHQQQATTMVKLGGSLDAPIEGFPDYIQAKAGVEDAERNSAQYENPFAHRRRCDASVADRTRPGRGRRSAGLRGRGEHGPLGRREPEGIGHDLRSRWAASDDYRRRFSR